MDGGAWWTAVHGVSKSWTRLSDFTFTFHFHALEREMATHSSVLAWRIPGTGKPGGLPSMGSHRVGHDWSDLAAAAASKILSKNISYGRYYQGDVRTRESVTLRFEMAQVLVIYCCITNYPKLSSLIQETPIISYSFCGLGIWVWLSWGF